MGILSKFVVVVAETDSQHTFFLHVKLYVLSVNYISPFLYMSTVLLGNLTDVFKNFPSNLFKGVLTPETFRPL